MKKLILFISLILILCIPFSAFAKSDDVSASSDAAGSELSESDSALPEWNGGGLIRNGDFSDDLNNWTYYAYNDSIDYTMEVIPLSETDNCLHLNVTADNDARAQQILVVEPESYYSISAMVKTKDVVGGNGVSVSVDGIIGAYSNVLHGTNDWTLLTLNGVTGKGQSSIIVSLRIGGYSAESKGEAWFTHVSAVKLDEKPAGLVNFYNNNQAVTNEDNNQSGSGKTLIKLAIIAAVVVGIIVLCFVIKRKRSGNMSSHAASGVDNEKILLKPTDTKLHFSRKDTVFMLSLTLVYAVVALTNLGTTQAPSTEWTGNMNTEPATIEFDGTQKIKDIYIFGAVLGGVNEKGKVTITDDSGTLLCEYEQLYTHMYRWHPVYKASEPLSTSSITITPTGTEVNFKEIAFFDADGNHVYGKASGAAAALVDEPEEIPDEFSSRNGMYFDELYHGRTAYEHLHFLETYEISHPPLGKLIISIGIAIFGMNAFGWRIMGVLFGIGMVPILYCFAKYVFKKSNFALIATTLFAFDFMHFTQTRIATVDVYGVFFIMLMFYFMYKYFTMSFYRDGLLKTFIPLGLAGIFFGLGAASKWICFYAGAGLAIMLLISFIQRAVEYFNFRHSDNAEYRTAVKPFWRNVICTILFCVVFFIVIPAIIYCLSYMRYPNVIDAYKTNGLSGYISEVWKNQVYMYSYHSGLEATHTYQSTWYQWIADARPIWYSINYYDNNYIATISAMGNPIVWWLAFIGFAALVIEVVLGKIKADAPVIMIFIGVLCNLLPWMLISRCAFIYHYFATVPFLILAAVYFLMRVEERHPWTSYFKWTWAAVALCLFALFYPVIAGIKIPQEYALNLEWMKSWWFVLNAPAPTNAGVINGIITIFVIVLIFIVLDVISYQRHNKRGGSKNDKDKQ